VDKLIYLEHEVNSEGKIIRGVNRRIQNNSEFLSHHKRNITEQIPKQCKNIKDILNQYQHITPKYGLLTKRNKSKIKAILNDYNDLAT
jgi:hypothetical protein